MESPAAAAVILKWEWTSTWWCMMMITAGRLRWCDASAARTNLLSFSFFLSFCLCLSFTVLSLPSSYTDTLFSIWAFSFPFFSAAVVVVVCSITTHFRPNGKIFHFIIIFSFSSYENDPKRERNTRHVYVHFRIELYVHVYGREMLYDRFLYPKLEW